MTALVVAGLSAREVSRRRAALVLMLTLPLWFYLVRRDHTGSSIRLLTLGLGWAVSTLTLFVMNASRGVDPRLRLTGASVVSIVGGRLLAMTGIGLALVLAYATVVALDQDALHPWAVNLLMVVTVVVAAPLGGLIGAILPRELEGAFALFSISAVQMLADPAGVAAKLLPFWSSREIGNYAIDGGGLDLVWRGLAHGAAVWLLTAAATFAVFAWRLRIARYPEPSSLHEGVTPA